MTAPISDATLDAVLAIQLTVAWAGEARCEPKRLGWWDTDLVDAEGGGDFFARLLPQTARWAALEACREAARRVDERARLRMASPDGVRTIFFFGFELDERLSDRFAALKRAGRSPVETLAFPLSIHAPFDREKAAGALAGAVSSPFAIVPGGRELEAPQPTNVDDAARRLAAALVPFAEQYPLPFFLHREPRRA